MAPPMAGVVTEEAIEVRVHPSPVGPTVVYLPGLHGDWTLVGAFRRALAGRATFVELTYPRTLTWDLTAYGRAVGAALTANGIGGGWLLAESFGSQVAWAILGQPAPVWQIEGLILAGGFVRYSPVWLARGAARGFERISVRALRLPLRLYAWGVRVVRWRAGTGQADLEAFVARRTELDKAAAVHRLRLLAASDWRQVARATRVPVFHLAGLVDPVVCWWPVRRWLRRSCPGFLESRLVMASDHNVLGSAPAKAAEQVLRWIESAGRRGAHLSG